MKLPFRSTNRHITYETPEEGNLDKSKYAKQSESQIWHDFKRGDEAAFNYIYRRFVNDLYNFGCNLTIRTNTVQDAIQNVFIDIRRRRERLADVQNIKSYLFKALYRELIKRLEKERKFVLTGIEIEDNGFDVELSSEEKMINYELGREKKVRLEELLNSLTNQQKKALLLFYTEGFTYSQIADTLGFKSVKSARKLVYRALNSAKGILGIK